MNDQISGQELFFNGINGDSGEYDLPPMSGAELFELIQGEGQKRPLIKVQPLAGETSSTAEAEGLGNPIAIRPLTFFVP